MKPRFFTHDCRHRDISPKSKFGESKNSGERKTIISVFFSLKIRKCYESQAFMTGSYAKPMQYEPERELISSPPESFESFVHHVMWQYWIEKWVYNLPYKRLHSYYYYYYYNYMMRFWSQIVAFYFLQFINVWISVIMALFHNIAVLTKEIN